MYGNSCSRCSTCGINWQPGIPKCEKCGGVTDFMTGQKPHTSEEIKSIMAEVEAPRRDKVVEWRLDQLLAGGLDLDRAQRAAADRAFDIERFRSLRRAECTPDLAYDIVR